MAIKVGCVLDVFETQSIAANQFSMPTCSINLLIQFRYRLTLPSSKGVAVVIEDVVCQEQSYSFRVPIISPLSMWSELYLSGILKNLNLEASVHNFLLPRIVEAALSLARRSEAKGFALVVRVGIFKSDVMSEDETDRISSELINNSCGFDSSSNF